jgi:hypothetical protein
MRGFHNHVDSILLIVSSKDTAASLSILDRHRGKSRTIIYLFTLDRHRGKSRTIICVSTLDRHRGKSPPYQGKSPPIYPS